MAVASRGSHDGAFFRLRLDVPPARGAERASTRSCPHSDGGRTRRRRAGLHRPRGLALGPRAGRGDHGQPLARPRRLQGLHALRPSTRSRTRGSTPSWTPRSSSSGSSTCTPTRWSRDEGGRPAQRADAAGSGLAAGGSELSLRPIAERASDRHLETHADELARYGPAHARLVRPRPPVAPALGGPGRGRPRRRLRRASRWLASVLGSRDYPLTSLADALETLADEVEGVAAGAAGRLRDGAVLVRP